MTNNTVSQSNHRSLKDKLKEEAKKAFTLTLYFGAWFCSIAFFAATALEERPIPLDIFGFALIKAGISAKFMLIAQAAYPIKVNKEQGILNSLLFESIVYLIFVLGLNFLEAGVDGLIHGKEFISSMTAFGNGEPLRIFAISILYWLIVWPYLIFMGVNQALGNTATLAILFGSKK
ncbi:hypothetical protein [Polynucleobacter sp. MWH-Aus1W21]|jgi:hypothetical protein|uniref:hypothetical protein n=1 Tax=Polynucleobacter sp. MWH-Aus1W21 TaxID=1855880 RepID=UPI001BFE3863|nr:hypothetical protein [Polynucleobacter sp. MWH-Aus1W21]QWD67129.1 hypothetical protein ICW03_04825 [Polynucleobacter sp. MWH-Aus1W21]